MQSLRDNKTQTVAGIIKKEVKRNINNLLVVGCGSGVEAAILAEELNTDVTGIDIEENFYPDAATKVMLQKGDATALNFSDKSFDFVYSYHSLEHISDPMQALREIKRVLTDDGAYWIGTPNRNRILGYLGSKDATFKEKIQWNLNDFKARLQGRFRNEYGAHAGFTERELDGMLKNVFTETRCITPVYFHEIYSRHQNILNLLEATGLSNFVYPSIYFMGKK